MGRLSWVLLLLMCLLSIGHAQLRHTTTQRGGTGGGLVSADLKRHNQQTGVNTEFSFSENFHFYEQSDSGNDPEYIFLGDPELPNVRETRTQPQGTSKPPTLSQKAKLLSTVPVTTTGSTPAPTGSTPAPTLRTSPSTNPVTLNDPGQGTTKSGNIDVVSTPANCKPPQETSPVSQSTSTQAGGTDVTPGGPGKQANINKDVALEGETLIASILLSQQKDSLRKALLGNKTLPAERNELLEAAGSLALNGLLCKGPLGGLCGHGSLEGMNGIMKKYVPFWDYNWLKIMYCDIRQLSWKANTTSSLQMNFQLNLTVSFPGMLSFLSASMIDVNIDVLTTLQKTKPDRPLISMKECRPRFTKLKVGAGSLLSPAIESMIKGPMQRSLRYLMCPVIRLWFYLTNQQLLLLQNIQSYDLHARLYSALTQFPLAGEYHRLDLQNKHFPASFINWLIDAAGTQK